jgi:hypothetical protein
MAALSSVDLGEQGRRHAQEARESLEHNELELAIDSLAEAADQSVVPDAFWDALEAAASNMKLQDRATDFRLRATRRSQ